MASYSSFFSAFMLTRPLHRLEQPCESIPFTERLRKHRKEMERLDNTIRPFNHEHLSNTITHSEYT